MLNTLGALGIPSSTASSSTSTANAPALYIVVESVGMRRGIEALSAYVEQHLQQSVCAGAIYLFSNTRRNRIKLIVWDATGVWLAQRRLHQGRFVWPKRAQHSQGSQRNHRAQQPYCINSEAWQWLIAGVALMRLSARVDAQQHSRVS